MKIQKDLERANIDPLGEVSVLEKEHIIKRVISCMINAFPFVLEKYDQVVETLYEVRMYYAKLDKGYGDTTYFYKNKAIYLLDHVVTDTLSFSLLTSCIQYLQDVRKNDGTIKRMGLCEFEELKIYGLGLNEMFSRYIGLQMLEILDKELEENTEVFYTDVLFKQINCIVSREILLDSLLFSNDCFKDSFMNEFGEEGVYRELEKNFDVFLNHSQKKVELGNSFYENVIKIEEYNHSIEEIDLLTKNTFYNFQERMFDKYFQEKISQMDDVRDVQSCKRKLEEYKTRLFGIKMNECEFVKNIEIKLENKEMQIYKRNSKDTVAVFHKGYFFDMIRKVRKILFKADMSKEDE